MTTLILDASVWVSAADATDGRSESSRAFLSLVVDRDLPISLPELAKLEIACALARRLRDAERGRRLADRMRGSPLVTLYPLNRTMLRHALEVGTRGFLRSGDALYAALAHWLDADVVSWDRELIRRAGALTPTDWIERNE